MMDICCGLVVNSEITWAEMRGREMERTNGRIEVGEVTKGWGGRKREIGKKGLKKGGSGRGKRKRNLKAFVNTSFRQKVCLNLMDVYQCFEDDTSKRNVNGMYEQHPMQQE